MSIPFRFYLVLLFGFAFTICASANQPRYVENKGQWHDQVLFKVEAQNGIGYVNKTGFTFAMLEDKFYNKLHDWIGNSELPHIGNGHAIKINFLGGNMNQAPLTGNDAGTTEHYFIGNDPQKWAENVRGFDRVKIPGVYSGIDVEFAANETNLKYDFILAPHANPNLIQVEFLGQEELYIRDGSLIAKTSVGDFTEVAPYAFQIDANGKQIRVACNFALSGNVVSYHFPEGYDKSRELIIDPEIAFSTYIGSTSNSFGFTASYDNHGNLYGGAVVFGDQYPTSAGAFQIDFGNGVVDCGISKFSSDGTDLLFSTYIGGLGNEAPHSLVVNNDNELYILGTTSSEDFPVSAGAFQPDHAGGFNLTATVGFAYENGSDFFITKLSENGNSLVASTYIGGGGNDGLVTSAILEKNYGDQFRGEIVVDTEGNAYVASVTASGDFPIVNGFSPNIGGVLSGVVFKLSSDLQTLIWSTYSGGNFTESAMSLALAPDNSVYYTGGTTSTELGVTSEAYQSVKSTGVDGYIGHISADGSQLLASTYNGTPGFDQNYFVQLDTDGFVYVVGQSTGSYPVSEGVYANPNSGQYIQKFTPDLTTSIWSTTIGSGSGGIDISPSAFLVSNCGQIYLSGWGGPINSGGGTHILPVTSNAFQSTTDGEDFYLLVLEPDASDLLYGTFFGGSQSPEHVDGGTSRFDKNGTVYQAVCAGCFGNDDFPTQPGVWSETNGSTSCNLGVFKFNLSAVNALAQADAPDVICPGAEFTLVNQSVGADTFVWDMGDGFTTTDQETTYAFDNPGTYTIKLYAEDSQGCLSADSTTVTIEVAELPVIEVDQPDPICNGESIELNATGNADQYMWIPATGLSATNISNPIFNGSSTQEYTVIGSSFCGTDTVMVLVSVGNPDISVSDNQEICPGESVQLEAVGGETYVWSPADGLNDPSISNPIASPLDDITYEVEITDAEGCVVIEQVFIHVLPPPPELTGKDKYVSCNGSAVVLNVSGADEYVWSPSTGLSNTNIANPVANPAQTTQYTVVGTNSCGEDELSVKVFVQELDVFIEVDSIVCANNSFIVTASGADSYIWQPADFFLNYRKNPARAVLEYGSNISVTGFDSLGCFTSATQYINVYPRAVVHAGNDRIIQFGDEVVLQSNSVYPITWESSPYLSCLKCNQPYANPPETTTFYASIISPDGCDETDSVNVFVRGNIYVPNAFTPDGDGLNDIFKAEGVDISEFKMEVFNRWGDLVFISENIRHGWDGSHRSDGYYCPADIYQYRIVARENHGDYFELNGHVTLLR